MRTDWLGHRPGILMKLTSENGFKFGVMGALLRVVLRVLPAPPRR